MDEERPAKRARQAFEPCWSVHHRQRTRKGFTGDGHNFKQISFGYHMLKGQVMHTVYYAGLSVDTCCF